MRNENNHTWFDKIVYWWRHKFVYQYLSKDKTLCDIGCGDGKFIKDVSRRTAYAYGYDGNTSTTKERFDIVTAFAVMEHIGLNDIDAFVDTLAERRKDNGTVILTTPSPFGKPVLEFLVKVGLVDHDSIYDHKHYYTKRQITELLLARGFKKVVHKYFQFGINQLVVAQ